MQFNTKSESTAISQCLRNQNFETYFLFFRFIDDADGLSALLDFLAAMDYVTLQSPIHTAALSCLKALMNNSVRRLTF